MSTHERPPTIDPEFLALLVCPLSRAPLVQDGDRLVSTDPKTRMAYPIIDDIPNLLIEDGNALAEDEWKQIMAHNSR
jgi:uncharacterized protein